MACYSPLPAYMGREINPKTGKRKPVFNPIDGYHDKPIELPCGQCIGCRIDTTSDMAVRIEKEAKSYDKNIFITLTYNEDNMPKFGDLVDEHITEFLQKLRDKYVMYSYVKIKPNGKKKHCRIAKEKDKIRYYCSYEYGGENQRPHYHLIVFNLDFKDKKVHKVSAGIPYYTSKTLEEIWNKGHCIIGEVNYDTAFYVAGYCLEKMKISDKTDSSNYAKYVTKYMVIDFNTGEILHEKMIEKSRSSRRPGIGYKYYKEYEEEIKNNGNIIVKGKNRRIPRYYETKLEKDDIVFYRQRKKEKMLSITRNSWDNTRERLEVRKNIATAKLSLKKKEL